MYTLLTRHQNQLECVTFCNVIPVQGLEQEPGHPMAMVRAGKSHRNRWTNEKFSESHFLQDLFCSQKEGHLDRPVELSAAISTKSGDPEF